ncbi:DNA-directed RNA polymerase III subunit rpc6 [Solanum tuberosum]|uniref:DNA-directed RNA polymerase III subunit F n=1 Tax=Solanum tuberosum TaxID=4113 RepID=M1ACG2_SOLTU|nr:PREDICTED: DNA-directed RNA polymerase III subunit rpc6 [Solanum tuberosum]
MSRSSEAAAMKRKRLDSSTQGLVDAEFVVLNVVKSKKNLGVWVADVKKEANIAPALVDKCLTSLVKKNLIKKVPTIQNKAKKHYMAVEYEPSEELTGGAWYSEGKLDKEFITVLRETCLKVIGMMKVATVEGIHDFLKKRKVVECCTSQQVGEILNSMVLDDAIIEVKSTGLGEYHSIPIGSACYRIAVGDTSGPKTIGPMASIPCGACPRISVCTPDGIISPKTCVYYTKWLNIEF